MNLVHPDNYKGVVHELFNYFKRGVIKTPRKDGSEFRANGVAHPIFYLLARETSTIDEFLSTKNREEFSDLFRRKERNRSFRTKFAEACHRIKYIIDKTGFDRILSDDKEIYMNKGQFGLFEKVYDQINKTFPEWKMYYEGGEYSSMKWMEYDEVGNRFKNFQVRTNLISENALNGQKKSTEHKIPRIWIGRRYFLERYKNRLNIPYMVISMVSKYGHTSTIGRKEHTKLSEFKREAKWNKFFGTNEWENDMGTYYLYTYRCAGIDKFYDKNSGDLKFSVNKKLTEADKKVADKYKNFVRNGGV